MHPLRRACVKSDHLKQGFRERYRRIHFRVKLQSLPALRIGACQRRVLRQLKCSVVYFCGSGMRFMYNFRPNQVGYRMGALSPTDLIIA
jgi:hypothetical protein